MENEIIEAVREHAEKFESAAAADRLQIKSLTTKNGELQQQLNDVVVEIAGIKSFAGRAPAGIVVPSVVAEFIKSDQLKAMRDGANGTGRVSIESGSLKLLTKAISNTGVGQSSGDQSYNVQPNRWDGLGNNPVRPLSLLDVMPSIPVSTGTFEYMQLNGYSNAAAVQAKEGDAKALATVPTAVITAYVATIAHYVKASQQVLDDAPALSLQLDNLLSYGCMAKLENQLINGAGTTGKVKGLLTGATEFVATADDAQDRIGEAVTELLANGWVPSVIVMNPVDWGAIQRARGATNDTYLLGSPRDPAPPSLWSVPVVLSASLLTGTALVLDASQTALLDRQQVVIATSREDGSNFTTNMVSILAELRAGLAVFSPGAVLSVSLVPTT